MPSEDVSSAPTLRALKGTGPTPKLRAPEGTLSRCKGGQHVDLDNIHGQGHPNQVGRLESKTPSPMPASPIILFPS